MHAQERMQAEQLQSSLTAALADDQRTEDILRERTSIPGALLTERRFKEVYITAEKAVELGLAHAVCDFSLPEGTKSFKFSFARCITLPLSCSAAAPWPHASPHHRV